MDSYCECICNSKAIKKIRRLLKGNKVPDIKSDT